MGFSTYFWRSLYSTCTFLAFGPLSYGGIPGSWRHGCLFPLCHFDSWDLGYRLMLVRVNT